MRRRWSPASKLFAVLAVASGLAAFALVRGYQTRLEHLRPDTGPPVRVVVAAHPIERGTVLVEGDLDLVELPERFSPPGRVSSVAQVAGRTTLTDIAPGELVTATRLAPAAGPVAAVAPPGTLGFPIAVQIPPGAVRPGDLVEVLATFGGHHPHSETVATGLLILSVLPGQRTAAGFTDAGGPTLVLAVTSDVAERLAYATAFGRVSVAIEPVA